MIKILFILFFNFLLSDTTSYLWPTDEIDKITTNFCEPRYRRFHAGIDVRTFGRINDNLYAIETGHISRIKISPGKYGKAIYLTLNDGNIALYSHLNKFNPNIEAFCLKLMKRYDSSFFDHFLKADEVITINKGDIIGYSGDTGSLSGPHLHFEIRDSQNQPLNPLTNFYSIGDSHKPYANNIAFIPLNNNCWIDGVQDYKIYQLTEINNYKYIFEDTISIIGDFGIAIEAYDKVDNQPFKYGVYNIELYIDNVLKYSTTFDKYNFKQDNKIYNAIDYQLLNNYSGTFYKLFNDADDSHPFTSSSLKKIHLDKKFHNLIINISDANDNKIQIQGVISGDTFFPPQLSYHLNNDDNFVIEKDLQYKNIIMELTTRYNDLDNYQEIIFNSDNKTIEKTLIKEPYNIIKYYYKKNNIKSNNFYFALENLDPYKIKGEFNIKSANHGFIIEFIEDSYSGYEPIIISNNQDTLYSYRKHKNIISTNIIKYNQFSKFENIQIIYKSNPEIIFKNTINLINSNRTADRLSTNEDNSFFIQNHNININNDYTIKPFSIHALQNNFHEQTHINVDLEDSCKNYCLFKLNSKKDNWYYIDSINENKNIDSYIYTNEIYSVIKDITPPIIKDIYPGFGGNYQIKNIDAFSFKFNDDLSGVNPYKSKIYINNQKIFIEYIPYRNLIRTINNDDLKIGENSIKIILIDNAGNIQESTGIINIIE